MKKTLVVMAAGMGSRFGGLKQIEPVGPNGEFIIDYSVYDAVRSGFDKIVFVIKEEMYDIFMETIVKRLPKNIDISLAFQDMDDIPVEVDLADRKKPLGTGHAIYCARDYIEGNFAIINADDFYGYSSFKELSEFLDNDLMNPETYAIVGYELEKTITSNGSVKRGVCSVKDGYITGIDESVIEKVDNSYVMTSIETNKTDTIEANNYVSMNMIGFPIEFLNRINDGLKEFLQDSSNLIDKEYLVPSLIGDLLNRNQIKVKLLESREKWYGVTYPEDKELVQNAINKMIEDGIYPKDLWKDM